MKRGRQLDRLLTGHYERGKETLEMQLPDGVSDDRHAWAAAVGVHGREVYRDDDNDTDTQLQRLARLEQLAQREMARGWLTPAVKFHDFLDAIASVKACKQPGIDGVVAEMARALRWPTLLWVYLLFLVRLGGWETERPEAWREVVLVAIPKKTDKAFVRRGTCNAVHKLAPRKFYVRALQTAVRQEHRPHETNIRGFEPGGSTAGVNFETSAFLQRVVHPEAVYALMRESFDLQGRISPTGAPQNLLNFDYARDTRQGSADGPDSWNQVLDNALREPAGRWEAEDIGFRLATDYCRAQKKRRGSSGSVMDCGGGRLLHHLCWADDLHAIAETMDHLTCILKT